MKKKSYELLIVVEEGKGELFRPTEVDDEEALDVLVDAVQALSEKLERQLEAEQWKPAKKPPKDLLN
jgi:hypothetical protein